MSQQGHLRATLSGCTAPYCTVRAACFSLVSRGRDIPLRADRKEREIERKESIKKEKKRKKKEKKKEREREKNTHPERVSEREREV